VVDSVGKPVVPVQIFASESEHWTFVNYELEAPDGTFDLGPMIPGEWTLSFTSTGYPELEQTVTLAAGMFTDLGDIRLEAVPVEVRVREPAGLQGLVAYLWGGSYSGWVGVERGHVMLPPLGAGSYTLEIHGKNTPIEVRQFELVAGQQTNLEIGLQAGVVRSFQVDSPGGTERRRLTFTTFDGSGRELVSWRMPRNPNRSSPFSFQEAFRPEAVRLVVISEDGKQGEARLESEDVRVVLR
jgi:hypothetical protein